MKHRMFGRELQRFSIRKYSFGAASVLIGCILFMTGRPAFADSQVTGSVETANQSLDGTKGEEAANQLTVVQAVTEQKEEVVATEKEKSESSVSTSDLPMQAENPSTMSEGAADTSPPSARPETEAARAADEKESSPAAVDTTVRMAAAAGTTSSEEQQIPKQTLPSQGQYTYTKRTEVKNEPKATAPTQFYVNAGDKVFYDRVLTTDGYQWISYKSYSGIRRYAAIEKLSQAEPQNSISDTPQGTLTITNVDSNAGSFDVHVTNISAPKPIKKVALPTWSSVNGQDDIIWYDAKKQVDGTYKISVAARDHKYSTGEYNIHLYYLLADNQLVGVGGTQTTVTIGKPQGKLDITNNNPDTGSFDVVVSEVSNPYGVKKVLVPVWSSDKGQDDLVWYEAQPQTDGNYTVTVKASRHKNSVGDYHIHLYYIQDNGQLVGVGGTTTKVSIAKPKGTLKIENNNPDTGSFDVVVSGVSNPFGVKEVKLPTWSNDKGQDDLIWYTAAKQADGTYRARIQARDHKYSLGDYTVHLYYVQDDDKLVGVGGTQFSLAAKPKGTLKIENNNPDTGSFDVVVSGVSNPFGVKEVKLPTWSNDKGQDDLVWYTATKQADGTYKASIQARNHKLSTGEYHVHLYYVQDNGQLIGVGGTTTTVSIAKPKGTLTIKNNNPATGTFDVLVSGVSSPEGVREVLLPTWSSAEGQDDLIWYRGVRQADGVYKLTVKASDHKYSTGEYHVHLYYVGDNGRMVGVGGTKTTVSLAAPKGKLTIQNNNQQTGTFEVVVSEVENGYGIKEVKLPTWSSAEGQDDLIWYTAAKQADGTYKAQVNLRDHKYSTGEYNIHLYYVQDDGRMVGVGGTKTTANIDAAFIKKVRYNGSYYYVQGKYNEIVIANKKHPLASNYNPGENPTAKEAFVRLRNDMIAQGYNVGYGYSGFRSYDYQRNLYQHYVNTDGQAAADRYSARPGYSEHQTGLVFDLTDKSGNLLEDTAASTWLKNNAHRYGFVVRYQPGKEASTGYMPEAWHIRYIGQEAPDIYRSGLSLEEYYGFEGGDYATPPSNPSQSKPSLPAQGTYYFTKRSSIKAEPKQSSSELAYYTAGESVHYDRVLDADGMRWISYLSYSGNRRYISIG